MAAYLIQKQKWEGGDRANGLCQSISGSKIAENLGIDILTPKIKPKKIGKHTYINWGMRDIPWLNPYLEHANIINHPEAIRGSSNKLLALRAMADANIPTPIFTTEKEGASYLFVNGCKKIMCRTVLNGSGGAGIVVAKSHEELVDAPLYTAYVEKKWEFRVHVVMGKDILIQQKRRLSSEQLEQRGITERNKYIRNLENGYIFSNKLDGIGAEVWGNLIASACMSVLALGLDFGAVDLIVTKDGTVYVLEVNSAPGLSPKTALLYSLRFAEILGLETESILTKLHAYDNEEDDDV